MNKIFKLAIPGVIAVSAAACMAGTFSVNPARLFMGAQDRAAVLNVSNDGNEPLVLQAEVFAWTQTSDGNATNETTPSDDVFLSPPIMTLPPNSRQVLRLLRTNLAPLGKEQTFRMIVREVPEIRPEKGTPGVQFAVAYSLPIFVAAPGAKAELKCRTVEITASKVRAHCSNTGTAHVLMQDISVTDTAGNKLGTARGSYLLPNISRTYEIPTPSGVGTGKLNLVAVFSNGKTETFEGAVGQ